jgi:hypothetical protein
MHTIKLIALLPTVMLVGCMSYGSWLDQVGSRPNPPLVMSDSQAEALTQEADRIRGEAESVRARLAGEADRVKRVEHYRELQRIGERLAPLERSLQDAGRPLRTPAVQPVAVNRP